ncbi:hypothetical protein TL5118_03076 [Thalassovita autumnalis]|uniref:Uncharacterized protein n=1 Tax=Thalassovita autumnalis TaxID=2072972 RepID=A0A0P1G426_9RHOB|nr:hypothetical protein TL5118_03076 [Thalassovita autumnalis]CUH73680.1 hypothetical protein TL5120_03492 [Thalassovita autumnalis]
MVVTAIVAEHRKMGIMNKKKRQLGSAAPETRFKFGVWP